MDVGLCVEVCKINEQPKEGPWFRMSNLSYTDIVDLKSAGQELEVASYINSSKSEMGSSGVVTKEKLEVFLVPELIQLVSVAVFQGEKRGRFG
jgi:hypothetical protein